LALDGLRVVFIDDGGVLNDNERRAPQWRRLLGEYLTPRLGGTHDAWANANVSVFERSWARYLAQLERAGDSPGVEAWIREDRRVWMLEMCEELGLPAPPDLEAYAIATATWVSERVRADIPGAIDTVRWLDDAGLTLNTASGGLSWEIEPYLRGMDIRDRFDHLYGPDLVDRWKNGPHFYAAILADCDASPEESVVVEDSEAMRAAAGSLGLRTFPSLAALREALR
jgi:phosphoglycolate phosphatase-like HAD superfamily hydrolase